MSIEQLKRQRGAIKARLTSVRNFANRVSEQLEGTTKEEIELRLKDLTEICDRYQAIVQQLSDIDEGEYDQASDQEFEDRYFVIRGSLMQCLEQLNPSSQASTSHGSQINEGTLAQIFEQQLILFQRFSERSSDNGSEALVRIVEQQGEMLARMSSSCSAPRDSRVKLPTFKLPTFNGNIENWKRYADTFKTLIHDSDLSKVQKHQYLVGSLSGSAARIIESIQISEQNYEIAWDLLLLVLLNTK